ncbi:MAG: hypothetical protein AAB512_04775 [Patescibacteria group bacterium]
MDIAADVASEARIRAKQAGSHVFGQLQGAGSDMWSQITGSKQQDLTDDQVKEQAEASRLADEQEYIQRRQGIMAIYQEHRMKMKQEEQAKQQEEEQKKLVLQQLAGEKKREERQDVARAVAMGSAEKSRNMGAE